MQGWFYGLVSRCLLFCGSVRHCFERWDGREKELALICEHKQGAVPIELNDYVF